MTNQSTKSTKTKLAILCIVGFVILIAVSVVVFALVTPSKQAPGNRIKTSTSANLDAKAKQQKAEAITPSSLAQTSQVAPTTKTAQVIGVVGISADTTPDESQTSSSHETPQDNNTFTKASVLSQTQYSHTENGHLEGQFYPITATEPLVTQTTSGSTVTGQVARYNSIGLEKGSIIIDYTLNFDASGAYQSGTTSSSNYVTSSIALTPGVNYTNQTVSFLETSTGRALSGSLVYPVTASLTLTT